MFQQNDNAHLRLLNYKNMQISEELLQLGDVWGLLASNWGEVSEATHALLDHIAGSG